MSGTKLHEPSFWNMQMKSEHKQSRRRFNPVEMEFVVWWQKKIEYFLVPVNTHNERPGSIYIRIFLVCRSIYDEWPWIYGHFNNFNVVAFCNLTFDGILLSSLWATVTLTPLSVSHIWPHFIMKRKYWIMILMPTISNCYLLYTLRQCMKHSVLLFIPKSLTRTF